MTSLKTLIELEQDARSFGFDWISQDQIIEQVIDECREIREDITLRSPSEKIQEEIGDLIHAAAALCVFSGFDLEETISKTNLKFEKRVIILKRLTKELGLENLQGQTNSFILELWRQVKLVEKLKLKDT